MKNSEKLEPAQQNYPKLTQAHLFFFLLLFIVLYLAYKVMAPYINTIIMAIILATVLYPMHKRIVKAVKDRRNLAAFITCTILLLLIILPITAIFLALIQQGIHSFTAIQEWLQAGNLDVLMQKPMMKKIMGIIKDYIPDWQSGKFELDQNLISMSRSVGKFLFDQGGYIVGNVTALIAKFFLMIFVFFFMVRDGEKILNGLLHLIPLSKSQEEQIIQKIRAVSRSAILGTFVTALAQGAAGGIAFWISGLPGLFWGTMMAFASLIPLVGTALIWVPAAGYLFLSGHWGYGTFLTVWSILVVGSIDNFLRPMFMQGSAGMSPLLIFFAILGGINYFGLIGILYGPLIFGLAMVLLYIYDLEFDAFLKRQDIS
ncbi:AI-2E family transporter [bacterium]|nr:AI-2E family transporter [candidate division CSSED10-310 bacterium]